MLDTSGGPELHSGPNQCSHEDNAQRYKARQTADGALNNEKSIARLPRSHRSVRPPSPTAQLIKQRFLIRS
jgi:hypothetical protein